MAATTKEEREARIKGGLRAERNRANLTQKDVSVATGFNTSTISNWEQGAGSIGFEEAFCLADLYGVSLDQLAGRTWSPQGVA